MTASWVYAPTHDLASASSYKAMLWSPGRWFDLEMEWHQAAEHGLSAPSPTSMSRTVPSVNQECPIACRTVWLLIQRCMWVRCQDNCDLL